MDREREHHPAHCTLVLEQPLVAAWRRGQVLSARVTATPAPQTAILSVGADTVSARCTVPLTAGRVLRVRVETLGPHPVLRVL